MQGWNPEQSDNPLTSPPRGPRLSDLAEPSKEQEQSNVTVNGNPVNLPWPFTIAGHDEDTPSVDILTSLSPGLEKP